MIKNSTFHNSITSFLPVAELRYALANALWARWWNRQLRNPIEKKLIEFQMIDGVDLWVEKLDQLFDGRLYKYTKTAQKQHLLTTTEHLSNDTNDV